MMLLETGWQSAENVRAPPEVTSSDKIVFDYDVRDASTMNVSVEKATL